MFAGLKRAFARWEATIERGIGYYVSGLDFVLRHRVPTVIFGFSALALTLVLMWPIMRREFFPEVDAGAFEMYVRAPSGTRIEITEQRIKEVEDFVRETIEEESREGGEPSVALQPGPRACSASMPKRRRRPTCSSSSPRSA